jgi:hypothetical protein
MERGQTPSRKVEFLALRNSVIKKNVPPKTQIYANVFSVLLEEIRNFIFYKKRIFYHEIHEEHEGGRE